MAPEGHILKAGQKAHENGEFPCAFERDRREFARRDDNFS